MYNTCVLRSSWRQHFITVTVLQPNIIMFSISYILVMSLPPLHSSLNNISRTVWHAGYWGSFGYNTLTFSHFLVFILSLPHTVTPNLNPNLLWMGSPWVFRKGPKLWTHLYPIKFQKIAFSDREGEFSPPLCTKGLTYLDVFVHS